jgi:Zn-dependent protease
MHPDAAYFIVVVVLWVFSVCLHEFGHALVAYWGGDYTVRDKGYLTMNPLHYTHPVYSILMPLVFMVLGGIGLPGGAVYIDHSLLRSRWWETAVALAGVTMNALLVLLISACFKFGLLTNDTGSLPSVAMGFVMQLQISSILLNLIPVPPLDGFQAIAPWLPYEHRQRMFATSNVSQWVLFLALFYVRPVQDTFWNLVFHLTNFFGVDYSMCFAGFEHFRLFKS